MAHAFLAIQAYEIYSERSAVNVSLPAYIVYLFSSVFWVIYGSMVLSPRVWPMIISGTVAFLGGVIILVGIGLYGKQEAAEADQHTQQGDGAKRGSAERSSQSVWPHTLV